MRASGPPSSLRLAAACGLICLPAWAAEYRVAIEPSELRVARVEATLAPTEEGELLLLRDATDSGIEGGWARFLEDLEVVDPQGRPLAVEARGEGRYGVGAYPRVRVRYRMRLEHDRVENLPGADELAWARPEAVLWSGRALFVEGAPAADIEVTFALADGWRATTPWRVVEPGRRFVADDTDALLDSAFIAGEHFEARLGGSDDSPVRIALAGPHATSQSERVVSTVAHYVDRFTGLFGGPARGRLLLIAADGGFWGGGVLGTTISMLVGGALDASTLPTLRFITVHEAFHLWNANFRYRGRDGLESLYWMSEGTASYYTLRAQLGAGDLELATAIEQLAGEVGKYLAASGSLSMVDAGPTKLANYDLVYSGGFVAALALDTAIRLRSEDRFSLDDVMRSLHTGVARSEALDAAAFVRVIESVTGVSVADLFECCIAGTERLPLVESFRALGLALTVEGTAAGVAVDPAAPEAAAERRASWPLR